MEAVARRFLLSVLRVRLCTYRSRRWHTHSSALRTRKTRRGGISGAIAVEEVPLAFTVLGLNVKRQEIEAAVEEFNANKPSMEFPQFMQLMLSMLDKLPDEYYGPTDGKDITGEYTLPFPFYVKELLFGEKRNDFTKVALDSEVKFVPPINKSIEIDKPIVTRDGSDIDQGLPEDKLATFRTDLRYKEAKKAQIIHVLAVKTLRDFYDKGAWQV